MGKQPTCVMPALSKQSDSNTAIYLGFLFKNCKNKSSLNSHFIALTCFVLNNLQAEKANTWHGIKRFIYFNKFDTLTLKCHLTFKSQTRFLPPSNSSFSSTLTENLIKSKVSMLKMCSVVENKLAVVPLGSRSFHKLSKCNIKHREKE